MKPRRGAAALCCAVLLGGLAGCSGDAQPPVAEAPAPPTPAGLAAKLNDWAKVLIRRSDNMWDFRKLGAIFLG